jgi:predicted Fe-S protein YdhL (DUF1289 family)
MVRFFTAARRAPMLRNCRIRSEHVVHCELSRARAFANSDMTDTDSPQPFAPEPGDDVPSPCINVCTISPRTGWCEGCYRTLDEIAEWSQFSVDDKRAVLARLPARRWQQTRP